MNYEFHVGDYVETWDGWIGYIQSVNESGNSGLIIWTQGERAAKGIRCPFDRDSLDQYAKIIGTYNKELEAKKSKPIEKLSYEFDGEPISDKINELVDAVNKLMDKEDKNDKTTM